MKPRVPIWLTALGLALISGNARVVGPAAGGPVALLRTPDGGIQPQVQVDDSGIAHLIYLKGDPAAADIYYVRWRNGDQPIGEPVRVNSRPGSAIAIGTVRGAHLTLGKENRPHVAWMGSRAAEPRGPKGETPMLYARLDDAGGSFEPQRNVMQFAAGLDGGGSLAADRLGNVYVAWHARGDVAGEENRRVYVARSRDEGRTFSRETAAVRDRTGACGCCGMRAGADEAGRIYMLYRSATGRVDRDIYLLFSEPGGVKFSARRLHGWKIDACPMSTTAIAPGRHAALLAWETEGQIHWTRFDSRTGRVTGIPAVPGAGGKRRHPAIAANPRGQTIVAWTEGTGWNRGGSLAWQVFDAEGRPEGDMGEARGVAVWSLPAALTLPDGRFAIVY